MATSGRMTGNTIAINSGGDYYFIDWQLASQSEANNTSTINWQNYFHFQSSDADLDNGSATLGGSSRWSSASFYNYTGNFATRDQGITSGQFTVTHDGAGNYTLNVTGAVTAWDSGTSTGNANFALPTINRYATISSFTLTSVTDVGFTFSVTTDVTCDLLEYSLDNGANYSSSSGDFTTKGVAVTGLVSGTTYHCKVRVRRKDSQLKTTSSEVDTTTLVQNNFFDAGIF
jgi:hypothetical protein